MISDLFGVFAKIESADENVDVRSPLGEVGIVLVVHVMMARFRHPETYRAGI